MFRSFILTLCAAVALTFIAEATASFTGLKGLTFVTDAQAEVGRPLTATSVAGVARRSSRRQDRR